MVRDGSSQGESPTTLAGTPATVTLFGTGLSTTEPAATRAQWPISILPMILAPAPISTPSAILGWRSPCSLPVPPSVTSCSIETSSPITAVSPTTSPVAWSRKMPRPILRGRMDVALEHRRRAALKVIGEVLAALAPEPVRKPVSLNGVEALVVEHRLDEAVGRRIAVEHRDDVGAERLADLRLGPPARRHRPAGSARPTRRHGRAAR